VSFHPLEELEVIVPHRDFGARWNGAHPFCLAVFLGTDHKFLFLLVERVNRLLFLIGVEGVMAGSEGFVLLGQVVTDDVAAKRITVGFSAFVAAGLKFPSWQVDELFEFISN
jgi:hypothetical protein